MLEDCVDRGRPDPTQSSTSVTISSAGATPRWKEPPSTRPAVAIAPIMVERKRGGGRTGEQAGDEEEPAEQLDDPDP